MTTDKNIIRLTPKLFRELDLLTRSEVGAVLRVVKDSSMRNAFASMSLMAGDVFLDQHITTGVGCRSQISVIDIANRIDIQKFHNSSGPELDFKYIPRNFIYRFLILHEIGHFRFRCDSFLNLSLRIHGAVRIYWEILADRYAWKNLFPSEDMPIKMMTKEEENRISEVKRIAREFFPTKALPRSKFRVIPLTSHEYIPVSHVKYGIPWAS